MGAVPNQQPPNSQQQTSMKSQITSYNQSYNELNTSYEKEIMKYEESVHSGVFLSRPLVGLWHFETLNSYPQHINPFHAPTRSQQVLQRDKSNPNHQLQVCTNNPLEVQVTMILFRAIIEMGTPSYTPNQYSVPKMHHLSFPSQMPQSNHS
jgi:hypothetical protein